MIVLGILVMGILVMLMIFFVEEIIFLFDFIVYFKVF